MAKLDTTAVNPAQTNLPHPMDLLRSCMAASPLADGDLAGWGWRLAEIGVICLMLGMRISRSGDPAESRMS
jgi:hypothetical protein